VREDGRHDVAGGREIGDVDGFGHGLTFRSPL
jgi:hypothetical protein